MQHHLAEVKEPWLSAPCDLSVGSLDEPRAGAPCGGAIGARITCGRIDHHGAFVNIVTIRVQPSL
jgi:hypothetical protein